MTKMARGIMDNGIKLSFELGGYTQILEYIYKLMVEQQVVEHDGIVIVKLCEYKNSLSDVQVVKNDTDECNLEIIDGIINLLIVNIKNESVTLSIKDYTEIHGHRICGIDINNNIIAYADRDGVLEIAVGSKKLASKILDDRFTCDNDFELHVNIKATDILNVTRDYINNNSFNYDSVSELIDGITDSTIIPYIISKDIN